MPQNQTHPHTDTLTETERVDRHLWRIDVLGSKCLEWSARIACLDRCAWIRVLGMECLDRCAWIVVLGSECLDWSAWIGMLGSACLDRHAWIGVQIEQIDAVLGSEFQKGVWNREEFQRGVSLLEQRGVSKRSLEQRVSWVERERV